LATASDTRPTKESRVPSFLKQPVFWPLFWVCLLGLAADFFLFGVFMGIAAGAPFVGILIGALAARLAAKHPNATYAPAAWSRRLTCIAGGVATLGQVLLSGIVIILIAMTPKEWNRRISSEPPLQFLSFLPRGLDKVGVFMLAQSLVFAGLEYLLALVAGSLYSRAFPSRSVTRVNSADSTAV
jgi:pimeloyl-ACP methyl ester carboxylesterase